MSTTHLSLACIREIAVIIAQHHPGFFPSDANWSLSIHMKGGAGDPASWCATPIPLSHSDPNYFEVPR